MKKNKFFLPVSLSFMMCLTCSAVPASYAAETEGVRSIEEYSNDTSSDSKESDFQPVYDFHNMYGTKDENYSVYMEGELPVKEVLRDPDKYEEILMTEEETPECMLKYIYPDRYRNNSLVLNGALFPDMSLSLGDLNGDHQTDLTDLSILSLRLLGETELSKNQIKSADVDEDEMITVTDLSRIKQFVSHIISSL